MILRAFVLFAAFLAAGPAFAGDLRVSVTADGRPVADAVVTVRVANPPPGPIRFAWPMRIAQHHMQFEPFVLIAPAGATVAFPNLDDVRHQVYSFSQPGPFELRLYGHDETRSVQFRNVGVIAIGCNIHDGMSSFIYVTDTPFALKTDDSGVAVLHGVPSGAAELEVWHPYMRAAENRVRRSVNITGAAGAEIFQVRLRPPPDRGHNY